MLKFAIIFIMLLVTPGVVANSALVGVGVNTPVDVAAGIQVPSGFKATVFADDVGQIRHVVAADNGWVYGALRRRVKGNGAVALRDNDGDGIADEQHYFAKGIRGTGIGIQGGYLYFGTDVSSIRWKLSDAGGVPEGKPELIAYGFGEKRQHAAKSFTFDDNGGLYVNVGAPSNACMEKQRTKGSKGMDPCPILEKFGGVWKFDANKLMQEQKKDGVRYATGIRNAVAIDWNTSANSLYLVQHGRDQLANLFPDLFSTKQSAESPAEEFHKVAEGANIGWPYSYYDSVTGKRMTNPEYGGNGKQASDVGQLPLVGFPAHWAPNDLLFASGTALPESYQNGAFIAFHGSWNRAPLQQQGYRIAFVPMNADGGVKGDWITFAGGFAGKEIVKSPRDAKHRPTGLAQDADGALFVSSSMSGGRVWKITYVGS